MSDDKRIALNTLSIEGVLIKGGVDGSGNHFSDEAIRRIAEQLQSSQLKYTVIGTVKQFHMDGDIKVITAIDVESVMVERTP